jgi:gluconolactonase
MKLAILLLAVCGLAGAQNLTDIRVERAATKHRFTEGPVWSPEGFLLYTDIPANHIIRFIPESGTSIFRENSNGANGLAYDSRGRLYICESRTRRIVRLDKQGKQEVLAEQFEGKRFNAPNDIVVRRDGHVYFTDPAFGSQEDTREMDYYGVYHITPRGDISLVAKPEGRPNGIGLSPDGRILYVANSDERNLRAYDLDRGGKASNERVLVSGIDGVPDGITVDEKGNIYVTAKALEVYGKDGSHLGTVPLAETPANCAFGDNDLQGLYITARTSVYRIRLDVKGSVQY